MLDKSTPNVDLPSIRPNPSTMGDLYDVSETLGEGSFATVRLATRKSDGMQVAMKSMAGGCTSCMHLTHSA
jgi:serine/threonine protein kinase